MTRDRVLVLGASGFIGNRVAAALAASDWAIPIAGVHRRPLRCAGAVQQVRLDATDPLAMEHAVRGVSGVVNCVTADANTIVSAARTLFDCCRRLNQQPRIVHLSTMMVYGKVTGTVDETAPFKRDWDDYSTAKVEVEQLCRSYPSVVRLRPGIVYGPESPLWSERTGRWLRTHRLGDLGVAGSGFCNLVHVDDLVEAILRSLRVPEAAGESFNLSLPSPPTWNEYFRLYAEALDTTFRSMSRLRLLTELRLLGPPLKLLEIAAGAARLQWSPPPPIRPWLLRLCRQRVQLDVRKIERMLGMQWRPLDRGLRETAAHFGPQRRVAFADDRVAAAQKTGPADLR